MARLSWLNISIWVILLVFVSSCGPDHSITKPPTTFTKHDLIGTWEDISHINSTQTLILNEDHTFIQRYTIGSETMPTEVRGRWQMELRASSCIYIHLQGMKYIYGTGDDLINGNRNPGGTLISYREFCEESRITMPDKVVLSVGSQQNAPHGIVLRFPCFGDPCLDNIMTLVDHPSLAK